MLSNVEILGISGFVALLVASFAVGFRLLWLGARTRRLPELMIGNAFLWAGGVPGLLLVLVEDGSGGPDAHGGVLAAISLSLLLGVSLLTYFTWRVFRPDGPFGTTLFCCILAGLVIGHGGGALAALGPAAPLARIFLWTGVAFRIAAYAWAVAEATREYRAARRRCVLGLSDPFVANRMLLWAIGLGAVLAIWVHEAITLATGGGPGSYLVIALLGFVCAGALWLAFFPPAAYQQRFAARGER
jgi:hypothetical protein